MYAVKTKPAAGRSRPGLDLGSGRSGAPRPAAPMPTLADFYRRDSTDLFAKCEAFSGLLRVLVERGIYGSLYRVMLTSGLDHRITVMHPGRRTEVEMICFDSNSYLGLHRHPRVVAAVKRALDDVGFGTPSAQLLCGTNRYLRELEETVARFHGRDDAMVFPSGYAANVGAITALLRENDLVAVDQFSHASIHDGVRAARPGAALVYPHQDLAELERMLNGPAASAGPVGKLIVTDGVFSMHGTVAPLPALARLARRAGARLLVDEAHATGVIGPTGRGSEELFGLPGVIDVLVGTFSKAPGAAGGYVCGDRTLVDYLRFYARPGMFTAALPAATCAGLAEAFRVMDEEPEHRERLWENVRALVPALLRAGFVVPGGMESPIVTVFLGSSKLLLLLSRDLFEAGVKCGNVDFPAVPRGAAVLRLAVNARHSAEDIERAVEALTRVAGRYGILGRASDEIREIGERLALD